MGDNNDSETPLGTLIEASELEAESPSPLDPADIQLVDNEPVAGNAFAVSLAAMSTFHTLILC